MQRLTTSFSAFVALAWLSCPGPAIADGLFGTIHRFVAPSSYHQDRINKLTATNEDFRKLVYDCRLELQKMQRTRDIVIRQDVLAGLTAREAAENFNDEFKLTREMCQTYVEFIQENNRKIEESRSALSK